MQVREGFLAWFYCMLPRQSLNPTLRINLHPPSSVIRLHLSLIRTNAPLSVPFVVAALSNDSSKSEAKSPKKNKIYIALTVKPILLSKRKPFFRAAG